MKIKLKVSELRELAARVSSPNAFQGLVPRFGGDNDSIEFDHAVLEDAELTELRAFSARQREENPKAVNGLAQKLAMLDKLLNGVDSVRVTRLDQLAEALRQFLLKDMDRGWLYAERDGVLLPHLVSTIEYTPRDRDHEAHTTMTLIYTTPGKDGRRSASVTWLASDLQGGHAVEGLLALEGYLKETPELNAKYDEDAALYAEWAPQVGRQFLGVRGAGLPASSSYSYYSSNKLPLVYNGTPSKLVNDADSEDSVAYRTDLIWYAFGGKERRGDDTLTEKYAQYNKPVPVWFRIPFYHLEKDVRIRVHVSQVEPYVYRTDLAEKIVLPDDHRRLIEILVKDVGSNIGDIIEGKTEGTILIARGAPGTGKTLTAEVYSEIIQRPLYKVKSSQLGINIENLEKNLNAVLNRASRWGAVLLIDEADVYVRARGSDLVQNAVVGVFLRVLEYYRGLLIMTTNRSMDIDDAILSRATATLEYKVPNQEGAAALWSVMLQQFNVVLSEKGKPVRDPAERLAAEFPDQSGRTIKSLVKLTLRYAGQYPTLSDFGHCVQFLPQS